MKKFYLVLFLFLSCSAAEEFTNMKAPEVSDCSYGEGCIQVTFSSTMEKGITEQAFSCLCNSESASGTFVWYEKKMCFYPDTGIKEKSIYEIEIGTRAEDTYGNSLREVFCYTFSTKGKTEDFYVQKMNISDGDILSDLLKPIEITFSSPVDQSSFYKGFSISPSVKGSFSFQDDGRGVCFSPLEKLDWNSVYTVTLRSGVSDRYGNQMQKDYRVTFTTDKERKSNLENVLIEGGETLKGGGVVNRGIEKDAVLILTYSEPAEDRIIRNPITVSPSVDYTASWDSLYTQCTITFRRQLPYKTLLELSAGSDDRYLLYVDGEASRPLAVDEVRFYQDYPGSYEVLEYGDGIVFETSSSSCFEFVISAGSGAEIFTADAYGAVDVAVSRGNLTIDLKSLETEQIAPGTVCIRLFCSITAGTVQSPVIISVNGTLKDSNGNTLEKDFVLRINAL